MRDKQFNGTYKWDWTVGELKAVYHIKTDGKDDKSMDTFVNLTINDCEEGKDFKAYEGDELKSFSKCIDLTPVVFAGDRSTMNFSEIVITFEMCDFKFDNKNCLPDSDYEELLEKYDPIIFYQNNFVDLQ